jgi:tetratricopeptide (TPR) repeat protein
MKLNVVVFVIAAVIAPRVYADDVEDHVTKGTRYYNIGDWENALKEYKEAYTIDPKPELLWAIAQTQRQSGDCRSAILTYKAYLRGATATGATTATEWIKKCQDDLDAQRRAIDAAATTPNPQPVPVAPPAPPRSRALDPLGDALLVVGVGGLASGAVFLLLGNSAMNKATSEPTSMQYQATVDSARTKQQIGVGSAIGGAVFAALAIWRFASIGGHENEHAQAFVPVVVPGGAVLTYDTRF